MARQGRTLSDGKWDLGTPKCSNRNTAYMPSGKLEWVIPACAPEAVIRKTTELIPCRGIVAGFIFIFYFLEELKHRLRSDARHFKARCGRVKPSSAALRRLSGLGI